MKNPKITRIALIGALIALPQFAAAADAVSAALSAYGSAATTVTDNATDPSIDGTVTYFNSSVGVGAAALSASTTKSSGTSSTAAGVEDASLALSATSGKVSKLIVAADSSAGTSTLTLFTPDAP